jgi:glutathione peroxidase
MIVLSCALLAAIACGGESSVKPAQAPIYRSLTLETDERFRGEIQWNFTKFLVDPEGHVVARFEPAVEPLKERMISAIEELLVAPSNES